MKYNEICVIDNYNEIDSRNRDLFADYGIRDETEKRHICVICGSCVSINESYSNRGHNLICNNCFYDEKLFNSYDEAYKWVDDEKSW